MQLTYSVFVHIKPIESSATSSAAIAAVFIQCFPQKRALMPRLQARKVTINGDKETVTSLTIPAAVDGQADKR